MRERAGVSTADRLRQVAGVDFDGTGHLGHPAGCARVDSELQELGSKRADRPS